MEENRAIELNAPEETGNDVLSEIIGKGARKILKEALEIEIEAFVAEYRALGTTDGKRRIVRNGYLPERDIATGIGTVPVKAPRSRDREGSIRFSSSILPRYLSPTTILKAV